MAAASREVGRISVRVVPDTDGFRRSLKRQLESIVKGVEAKINIDPDLSKFREKVGVATKGLDTKVGVDADLHLASLRAKIKAFEKTTRPKINVDMQLSWRQRALTRMQAGLQSIGDTALKAASNISIVNDATLILLATAAIGAPALAVLSGALAGLPALLASIVIPIGAVALGFKGIAKAATVLGPEVERLQNALASKFEERLTPVFQKLTELTPRLLSSMPKVADALSNAFDGFVNVLTSGVGKAQIEDTINNVAKAINQAVPGVQAFTAAMLRLVAEGSAKLPGLSNLINDYSARLLNWVNQITTKGPDGVSQLDRALSGVGETIRAVLDSLGTIADAALKLFSDPKFTMYLREFFQLLKDFATIVIPLLRGAFMVFTQVIENFVIIWRGLVTAVNAVISAFTAIGLAVQSVVNTMASVGQQISNAWNAIPAIVSAVWNTVVSTVTNAIAQAVAAVTSGGGQILGEIGTWPGRIVAALAGLFQAGFQAGTQLVQGFIQGIGSLITNAVAKARELASSVKNAVTGFLGIHSPSTVMAAIGGFIGDGLINGMKSKQGEIEKTAQGIGQSIKDAFDWSGYAQRGLDAGFAFAGANADQLMSDLGISGKGLLSQLGEQTLKLGTEFAGQALGGSTFNFQVSNVDEAIAIKNNQLNRMSLGIANRSHM
ncbi:phage tail protein [Mycobacteroides abscessus]